MTDDGESTRYVPRVRYRYRVGDRTFEHDVVTIGGDDCSGDVANGLVARLERERRVVVYYDPARPTDAALVVGVSASAYFKLAFATTWLLFCFGFLLIPIAAGFGASVDEVTVPQQDSD